MSDEKFSAFVDDELSQSEFDEIYSKLTSDNEDGKDLKQRWQRYHLIGNVLQKQVPEKIDARLAERVMAELKNEPAIFVPDRMAPISQDDSVQNNASKNNAFKNKSSKNNKATVVSFPVFKQIAGLAVAASVMVVAILVTQSFSTNDGIAPTPQVAKSTAPAITRQQFARVSGVTASGVKATLPPRFQNRLNKYLINHNQYSSGVPGVLPYARIIGYTPGNTGNTNK